MNSIRKATAAFGFAMALMTLGTLVASPSLAEPTPWDEKEVTRLSQQLLLAVSKIKDNLSHPRETADPASARWVVLEDLMQLQHRVVAYDGLVRAGQSRAETEPVFRRIQTAVDHARRDAPAFPEVQTQQAHIDRARSVLEKPASYYED